MQGGRILIKHQAVALPRRHGERIEAVRALLVRASQAVDDDAPEAETLVNMAKMFASEEIMKVAQHAVELHGGNGVMLDFGIEKALRDAVIFMHMDAMWTFPSSRSSRHVPADGGQICRTGRLNHARSRVSGNPVLWR